MLLNIFRNMPVSKKRNKKHPGCPPRRRATDVVMTRPLWEYRSIAEHLADKEPERSAHRALIILLHSPYRLWDESGQRIRTVFPAVIAKAAGTSLRDWLAGMELLHYGGFLSWDDENQAH